MAWSFSSEKPVYIQIAERITMSVLSEEYSKGEQIPTVRQLALEAAVNPNTVQRAFAELEAKGIVVSKGTLGRFVTEDGSVLENSRNELAKKLTDNFVKKMGYLSVSKEEMLKMVEEA